MHFALVAMQLALFNGHRFIAHCYVSSCCTISRIFILDPETHKNLHQANYMFVGSTQTPGFDLSERLLSGSLDSI